jgi:hypothetical protein
VDVCCVCVIVSDEIDAARFYVNTSVSPPQSSWVHPGAASSFGPPPGPPPPDNRGYNPSPAPYPPQGGYNQGPPPQQGWGGQPGGYNSGYSGYQQGPPQEQRGELHAALHPFRLVVRLNATLQAGLEGQANNSRHSKWYTSRLLLLRNQAWVWERSHLLPAAVSSVGRSSRTHSTTTKTARSSRPTTTATTMVRTTIMMEEEMEEEIGRAVSRITDTDIHTDCSKSVLFSHFPFSSLFACMIYGLH